MKILFIGPLPEPVTGHSLACKVFLDALRPDHEVQVVNLSKDSFGEGVSSAGRVIEVFGVLRNVWRKKCGQDAIYLTISESLAGNIKDLCIYAICFGSLSKMFIHLHGGSIKRLLWDQHRVLWRLNRIFLRRLGGAIISGRSHLEIFDGLIADAKVHIVPNFAEDYLFRSEHEIRAKFASTRPLRVLFISNFIEKKGFNELAEAYTRLSRPLQESIRIDFAGKFESKAAEQTFVEKIAGREHIRYHGLVNEAEKKRLFSEAHVFGLPTSFLEGQPISILEAYAAGCVVLTTGQRGILDVFEPGVNGFEIKERSAPATAAALETVMANADGLCGIALRNRASAGERHRTSTYGAALRRVIEARVSNSLASVTP